MSLTNSFCALMLSTLATGFSQNVAAAASPGEPAPDTPSPMRPSTAQANVSVLPTLLTMPDLDRQRQLRIYLPPSYATTSKSYAVLYMHDGQNLFDDVTAYAGEWQVDETMNALAQSGELELIVVGIDNGGEKRMQELSPWSNPKFGVAEGRQYMDFIVNVVKPVIDKQYRTKPDRSNTAIMGSSMGGLISHYAILQYPDIFSKAGLFSPSYWFSNAAFELVKNTPPRKDARLYLMTGAKEGGTMATDTVHMAEDFLKMGHPPENLPVRIPEDGKHNEQFWRSEFRQAILWLFQK
ncbi:alpha/beta hydrolase [Undibacterium sp. TJN19]|uniref:alpha/beta hydrolase n=1 Tax=Undibacterium sp. TJN19 TaxID=3413055 RepID=UPI003BF0271F